MGTCTIVVNLQSWAVMGNYICTRVLQLNPSLDLIYVVLITFDNHKRCHAPELLIVDSDVSTEDTEALLPKLSLKV